MKALLANRAKDYNACFEFFKGVIGINELKQINKSDDTTLYNTGLAAGLANNKDGALVYFQKAADLGYKDISLYKDLRNIYYEKKDSASALKALNQGLAVYPDDIDLLTYIVYHYLSAGKRDKAMAFILKAKQKNPNNKIFWAVEGSYYSNAGNTDSAIYCYQKSIEIDPMYFIGHYRIGEIYLLHAVSLSNTANNELDEKKYKEKKAIADQEFKKAIPYLEKAYEVVPKDQYFERQQGTLENLNKIYIRFKKDDPKINERYDQIVKLLADLKNKKQ
jgi:tetratricopeptide (TPR) repeat protein